MERLAFHEKVVREASWHPYLPLITTSSWDHCIAMWSPSAEKLPTSQGAGGDRSLDKPCHKTTRLEALNDDENDDSDEIGE